MRGQHMRRLIGGVVAALTALPLIGFGIVTAAPAASAALVAATAAPVGASAANGVGLTPVLGWSSWSFFRHDPTAANIEAQALAMKKSGLAEAGFSYVNLDDSWYQCPGSQGPN